MIRLGASSVLSVHGAHLLLFGLPMVAIIATTLVTDQRAARPRWSVAHTAGLAGVATAAAGVVHAWVCPEHFGEATLYGVFFLVTAAVQGTVAALLLARPRIAFLMTSAAVNLGLVVLWAWTRTVGVPLGPSARETESVGGLDITASSLELLAVVIAVAAARRLRASSASATAAIPT